MQTNVGSRDAQVRTVLGAILGTVSLGILAGQIAGPGLLSLGLGVAAMIFLGTAATGQCGMYAALGLSTCSAETTN